MVPYASPAKPSRAMSATHWIDTPQALSEAVACWQGRDWLTVDTEFLRIDTYRPKLCLVQIGDGRDAWVIDTVAITDLSALFTRLNDPGTVKVFHAASQDLEIFAQLTGQCPAPIFDTQLAAALLGKGDQLGYAGLILKELGIVIDKSLSRTDWSRRPLTAAEIAYAAADVTHLATIYPPLLAGLREAGREAWLLEDASRAADPSSYETRPEDAWQRLKGLARLSVPAQRAAARISAWRETEAMSKNRPRGWIIDDELVYRLAERQPQDKAQLAELAMPPKTLERHHEALLQALTLSKADPQTALAQDERLNPAQKAQLAKLRTVVQTTAERLGVPAGLLAPRADLDALLHNGAAADARALTGWRRGAVGEALLAALE
jgi:ribonuclease D